jgi:MinD superfamily P-loop ATPase
MQSLESLPDYPIYFIMSDQPDSCGYCGARLGFLAIKEIEGERVFVNECLGCKREILMVEN